MALDPTPKNDEVLSESPTGDRLSTGPTIDTSLDDPFKSSLSEWRSAMKAMSPSENIQVAGMGTELIDSLRKWLWPPKSDNAQSGQNRVQAGVTTLESFTSKDIKSTSDKDKPPKISDLPIGGPHLVGRSKEVVTSLYSDYQTANLERFDKNALTAAHRTLPFNTIVDLEYRDPKTGVTRVVRGVRINDDGPHVQGNDSSPKLSRKPRELDVSPRVARELGFTADGVGVGIVKMTIVKWGDNRYANGGVHESGTDFRNKGRELNLYWGRSNFSVYK